MRLDGLPGMRLLKVNAAITYVKIMKRTRTVFLYFIGIAFTLVLTGVGLLLIGLSLLREFTMGVFLFGSGLVLIATVSLGFLLSQRTWMRIFKINQLIDNIKKGDAP